MTDKKFEPESVRAIERIRNEIINGVRPPGSRLVERELAEVLGISRLPIRDALRVLVTEGLVTPRPRSWATVREFTATDIADLLEVRGALETMAFSLAARRANEAGLARLRKVLDEELVAAKALNFAEARHAGAEFHQVVVELSGNLLLVELQNSLASRLRWLLAQHDDLSDMASEHERLYEAMTQRDVQKVHELVLRHLETSRGRVNHKLSLAVEVPTEAQG